MGIKTQEELLALYDKVGPFFEGVAQVCKNGRWFHINGEGTPIYEETFDWVSRFCNETARAQNGAVEILIGRDGKQKFL